MLKTVLHTISLMSKNRAMNLPSSNLKYYFIAAAVATAIADIVHLYMPLIAHPQMLNKVPVAT
jgi:hypothetical protein